MMIYLDLDSAHLDLLLTGLTCGDAIASISDGSGLVVMALEMAQTVGFRRQDRRF